ncbi:Serine/threonine-protein kinase brsk1 [Tritrichomonas musculus]
MKVKSGQFRMPEFPDDIKDLISRMLTVDPNKRISLAQIKEHPAFRQGIPQFYTFPSPLPLPSIKPPIDIAQLDEETINVLRQLGFDEDDSELSKELKSNEHSMAKVFVYMLTNRQKLDNLPWAMKEIEENVDVNGNGNSNGYESVGLNLGFSSDNASPELIYPADVTPMISSLQLNNYDQFHRMKNQRGLDSLSSPEHYSIIERSFFSEDAPTMICNATQEIKGINVTLENLFTAIQIWLPKQGFAWFYPDETKIIARKRSDQLDVIMQSVIDIDNSLTLMVSLPKGGNQDLFNAFVEELQNLINGIVPE